MELTVFRAVCIRCTAMFGMANDDDDDDKGDGDDATDGMHWQMHNKHIQNDCVVFSGTSLFYVFA